MADLQAYSCDAITGQVLDRIPVSAFSYSRMLSAGDSGSSATIPLDGSFAKSELRALLTPWARLVALERDGAVEYMGYSQGDNYTRGQSSITVPLVDWWGLAARRGAWDYSAPNVEKWSTTVTGNLASQAAATILRGRSGLSAPPMGFPMTIGSFPGGTSVTRKYFGYYLEYVADVLGDLLDEGLDIYFKPRWITNGEADWQMRAGVGWGSGVTREFTVTAGGSEVSGFTARVDAARVTNNAIRIGEGSEQDMLAWAYRNFSSPFPLLSRVSESKNVSDLAQLSTMALQDLGAFAEPTSQWEFSVTAGTPVDVGDSVRLILADDPWIDDGVYVRRVVGIKGDLSEMKTVLVQPTGGA